VKLIPLGPSFENGRTAEAVLRTMRRGGARKLRLVSNTFQKCGAGPLRRASAGGSALPSRELSGGLAAAFNWAEGNGRNVIKRFSLSEAFFEGIL
jgi:hypothetical protein